MPSYTPYYIIFILSRKKDYFFSLSEERQLVDVTGSIDDVEPAAALDITGKGLEYQGETIISKRRLEDILRHGEKPFVIGVKDRGETIRLAKYLKRMRAKEK